MIASNFFPIVSSAYIRDENGVNQLTIFTQHSHGFTSSKTGEMEIMLHRRISNGFINLDDKLNTPTDQGGFIGGKKILLVCDLWEHAYFCDYTTDREEYIRGWFECINWQMAEVRLLGEDMIFNLYYCFVGTE